MFLKSYLGTGRKIFSRGRRGAWQEVGNRGKENISIQFVPPLGSGGQVKLAVVRSWTKMSYVQFDWRHYTSSLSCKNYR